MKNHPTRRRAPTLKAIPRRRRRTTNQRVQLLLAIMVLAWVAATATAAIVSPAATAVFDRILPLLTLVIGSYFGQHYGQSGSS